MNNPIKIGIVGLGRAGWGMHLNEIENKDTFKVVAVCDIIPERVEKGIQRCGCKGYGSIEELIADEDVELVDIATRTSDHFEHAVKALKAGKNVLLEKPVTLSYEQTKQLFSLANKEGLPKLYIRQNRRFEKNFNTVWDVVKSGKLGEVFEITISQLGYQRRDDWQTLSEFGGGQLLNWGPHIIDQALRFLDSPVKEQFGDMKQVVAGGDCEDHFSIHFKGENGRKVNICISGACALTQGRRYAAYGSRGAVECDGYHVHIKYIDPEQVLPPVVSSRETPGASFGASGTFESAVNPNWFEEEFDITGEDLTVIWDYIYDNFRNGTEYPIKDNEVLDLMKVVSNMRDNKLVTYVNDCDVN